MNAGTRVAFVSLTVAIVASAGFIAAYATGGSHVDEGIALTAACAAFATAALAWGSGILPREQVTDIRSDYPSAPPMRLDETAEVARVQHDLSRSGALLRLLYAALGLFGLALIVPLRSLGPSIDGTLFHTKWRKGSRVVREDGSAVRISDLNVNSVVTVFPQGAIGDPRSQAVLIRLPGDLEPATQGYIVYSKVCTHAGCPVALYRAAARELMCPCHQSVFNVLANGAVVSGPADAPLPRLPIVLTGDGYLVAAGDFPEPVGPGFWERS